MESTVTQTSGKLRIKVIIGSTRPSRFSERPARYIYEELCKIENVDAELVDLRDYPIPFYNGLVPPARGGGKYDDKILTDWANKIHDGDAFIMVTPEYNHGYPAILKNAIDVIFPEWNHKAIGFVSYGNAGGARAIEQLVQVAVEMRLVPIAKSINIPIEIYRNAMSEPSIENSQAMAQLRTGIRGDIVHMFFDELLWMATALKAARKL